MVADLDCLGCAFRIGKYLSPFQNESCRTRCVRCRIRLARQKLFTEPEPLAAESTALSCLRRTRARQNRKGERGPRQLFGRPEPKKRARLSPGSRVLGGRSFAGVVPRIERRSGYQPNVKPWHVRRCRKHFFTFLTLEDTLSQIWCRSAKTATGKTLGWNDPADSLGAKARPNRGRSSPVWCFGCVQIQPFVFSNLRLVNDLGPPKSERNGEREGELRHSHLVHLRFGIWSAGTAC